MQFASTMGRIAPALGATVGGIVRFVALLYVEAIAWRGYEQFQAEVDADEVLDAYGEFYELSGGRTVPRVFVAGFGVGVVLTVVAGARRSSSWCSTWLPSWQPAAAPSAPPLGGCSAGEPPARRHHARLALPRRRRRLVLVPSAVRTVGVTGRSPTGMSAVHDSGSGRGIDDRLPILRPEPGHPGVLDVGAYGVPSAAAMSRSSAVTRRQSWATASAR